LALAPPDSRLVAPPAAGADVARAARRSRMGEWANVPAGAVLQSAEVSGPSRFDGARIPQELLVEILNETSISTGQRRGG